MIISNSTGYPISLRWNRYMGTYMVDITEDERIDASHPLRVGTQHFKNGIVGETTLNVDCCNRYPCDIKDSETRFYIGCGPDTR